jgi:hypothetical protein
MTTITLAHLIAAARDLRGDEPTDNPEYDRALVELVASASGIHDGAARELVEIAILGRAA